MMHLDRDEFAHTMAEIICESPNKEKFGIVISHERLDSDDTINLNECCKISYSDGTHFYRLHDFPIVKFPYDDSILIRPRTYDYNGLYELYKLCKMLQKNHIISTVRMGYTD